MPATAGGRVFMLLSSDEQQAAGHAATDREQAGQRVAGQSPAADAERPSRDARVVARIRRMGGRSCEPRHCRGSENQARMKLLRQ